MANEATLAAQNQGKFVSRPARGMPTEKPPSGAEQAAILLLALGEGHAATVLQHLGQREVQALMQKTAALQAVSIEQLDKVLERLESDLSNQTSLAMSTESFIRNVMTEAFDESRAGSILDKINGRVTKGLESLKWMEARAIAEMILQEHPQIICLVVAHLEPDQAAEVLQCLPARVRSDAILRIATLDGVQPHALNELDEILDRQLSGNATKLKSASVGGLKAAANILNEMDSSQESELLASIRDSDAKLAAQVEELMFTFDDLANLDDRSMQVLLRETQLPKWVVALKASDDEMLGKIFKNMSTRAADMLRDDIEVSGPMRISDVNAAQKEILTTARNLAEAGQISLSGGSDQMVG